MTLKSNANAVPIAVKWRKAHKLDESMVNTAARDAVIVSLGEALAFGATGLSLVTLTITYQTGWVTFGVTVTLILSTVAMVGYRFVNRYQATLPFTQEDEYSESQRWEHTVRRSERVEARQQSVRVVIEDKSAGESDVSTFPLGPGYLERVAVALGAGASFSRPALCEKVGTLSQGNFRQIQTWALSNDLLTWRDEDNPKQGTILTDRGEVFFGQIAKNYAMRDALLEG